MNYEIITALSGICIAGMFAWRNHQLKQEMLAKDVTIIGLESTLAHLNQENQSLFERKIEDEQIAELLVEVRKIITKGTTVLPSADDVE